MVPTPPNVAPAVATAATQPKLPSAATPPRSSAYPSWRGEWIGTLDCGKGPVRLKLLLMPHLDPMLGVQGEVVSIGGKKPGGVPYFQMIGEAEGARLRLRWERWAYEPLSDRVLNLDGEYVAATERLALRSTDGSCKPLEMERVRLDNSGLPSSTSAPAAAPASSKTVTTAAAKQQPAAEKPASTASKALTHAQFVQRLSQVKLNSLIGVTLTLNLQSGGDGGWPGFVQSGAASDLVFYSCPKGIAFSGGPVTTKIARLRSNDNGVFVDLYSCKP